MGVSHSHSVHVDGREIAEQTIGAFGGREGIENSRQKLFHTLDHLITNSDRLAGNIDHTLSALTIDVHDTLHHLNKNSDLIAITIDRSLSTLTLDVQHTLRNMTQNSDRLVTAIDRTLFVLEAQSKQLAFHVQLFSLVLIAFMLVLMAYIGSLVVLGIMRELREWKKQALDEQRQEGERKLKLERQQREEWQEKLQRLEKQALEEQKQRWERQVQQEWDEQQEREERWQRLEKQELREQQERQELRKHFLLNAPMIQLLSKTAAMVNSTDTPPDSTTQGN